jgi:hypothetical protein
MKEFGRELWFFICAYQILEVIYLPNASPNLRCQKMQVKKCKFACVTHLKNQKSMSKENLLKEQFVEIHLDKSTNVIVAKWIGFLKPDDVRKGCTFMTKYIKDHGVQAHLSDHRQLKVLSKEVQDYLTGKWFPEVEKVGLRKVGAVVAEDVFAAATVSKVNKEASVGNLKINMFNSEPDCVKWLLN